MTSVYNIPHQGYYVVTRAEYVELTGSVTAAQVLSVIEAWSKARESEIQRIISFNQSNPDESKPIPGMWLYEKIEHFLKWLPWLKSKKTIRSNINKLIGLGLIEKRTQQSSTNKWDKTLEYRLNVKTLIQRLTDGVNITVSSGNNDQIDGVSDGQIDGVNDDQVDGVSDGQIDGVTATASKEESLPHDYNNNQISNNQISNDHSKNLFSNKAADAEKERFSTLPDLDFLDEEEDQVEDVQLDFVVETDIIPNSGHNKNSGSNQSSPSVLHNEVAKTTLIDKLINYEDAEQCRHELMVIGARESDGQWDEGFLEAVRQHLSRCSHYKGKAKATVHHAKRYCKKHYNCDPSALLAIAQSSLENPVTPSGLPHDIDQILDQVNREYEEQWSYER
ncbi:MAG: hypothetical protein WBA77_00425 [Microcoleaceae cyanobacterium]